MVNLVYLSDQLAANSPLLRLVHVKKIFKHRPPLLTPHHYLRAVVMMLHVKQHKSKHGNLVALKSLLLLVLILTFSITKITTLLNHPVILMLKLKIGLIKELM